MALEPVRMPEEAELATISVPAAVEALIADCEARYTAFQRRMVDEAVVAFVQSDLHTVFRALSWIRDRGLLPGSIMLEWGSGVGAVALLGASLGYDASGIEVEPTLVEDALELSLHHGIDAAFVCGSFLPEEAGLDPQDMDEFAWLDTTTPAGYDELELDIDDFDLVFAYPWPGEQNVMFELFDAYAARGACLLTNHGLEGLRLHRKA